jgi:hypothetical protein
MPRMSRFQLMERNKDLIAETFVSLDQSIFLFSDIAQILEDNKTEWSLPNITGVGDLLKFLLKEKLITHVKVELPNRSVDRYIFDNPSVYEIALSLNKKSYLSHYSALFLHGLTNNVTKTIYTNLEQSKKWSVDETDREMEQKNIDLAFSRPMRRTNQIARFKYEKEKFQAYLLNGKNHDLLGVTDYTLGNKKMPITDMERTLIDITVRPNYAGGIEEVLNAYESAKKRISVNKLLATLKKMTFIYPYHQLVGFYLEKAGYDENVLKLLNQFEIKYNFYLTYEMKDKDFSDRWRVFYPKGFATKKE